MSSVKILSLGYAVPPYSYSTAEIFQVLSYPQHFKPFFTKSQIEKRHFCLPLEQLKGLSFQQQQEVYAKEAVALARQAVINCLDGRDPKDIALITYATCTGFVPGPTVGHHLAYELGLGPETEINNLSALGCEASFPGLRRCHDFTALTRKPSLAIACELCSLTYYPEPDGKPDPENDYELLRSNAIFGDGCSCALVGYDDDPGHPRIIDFATHLDMRFQNELGYVWSNGRLRVRLSRRVPDIAAQLVVHVVSRLLARNRLDIGDIHYWVIHPPGAAVLDKVRDGLGIEEDKLKYSRQALRLYGNTSSSAIGIVGKLLMMGESNPGGYLVMVNVGPGMVANAVLLRFES